MKIWTRLRGERKGGKKTLVEKLNQAQHTSKHFSFLISAHPKVTRWFTFGKTFTPVNRKAWKCDYDSLHHVCTFSSVYNKKHVNRMIVRMKLVPRGNESSDNPPTLNLPGCRKPLAVVCVRDRCWTPSCRWTVCTRTCVQTFFFFFFFSPFFPSLLFRFSNGEQNGNSPTILTFQFCFFDWHVQFFIYIYICMYTEKIHIDRKSFFVIYNI